MRGKFFLFNVVLILMMSLAISVDARPRTRDEGLRAMYGQLVIKGFFGQTLRESSVRATRKALDEGLIGGVIFFSKNVRNKSQVSQLTRYFLAADTPYTPIIATDQEGGAVQRLDRRKGFTYVPGHFRMQQRSSVEEAKQRYRGLAKEMAEAGFNTNFGPVVDLQINPDNPIIARPRRSFGTHPLYVARYANSFIEAHKSYGIGTALKHWPGHGSSTKDTHDRFVDVTRHWKAIEIEPYRRLFNTGYDGMVMISHLYHSDWGGEKELPASLSPIAIKTMLRDDLGFDGLVITDDLQMRGITSRIKLDEAIIMALLAGNDIVLIGNVLASSPSNADFAINAIERGVKEKRLNFLDLYRSWQRVVRYKKTLHR